MARVRRDEAKAEEEEQRRLDRAITAENERRLQALRAKADDRMTTMFGRNTEKSSQEDMAVSTETGHVNFFQDLEREERKNLGSGNKDYEIEKKKEQQEWESKMGIQKMLGEGTNELDKKKEWYENLPGLRTAPKPIVKPTAPVVSPTTESEEHKKKKKKKKKRKHHKSRSSDSDSDSDSDSGRKKKKSKKSKKSKKRKRSDSSSEDEEEKRRKYLAAKHSQLAILREERIKRERAERGKTELVLHPELAKAKEEPQSKKPKYNSQFNPELSRN
ncbi:unnamed protein product [Auanema sp. JU1783]|nr:unnamed protein product [Auanema sp. JU1783]